MDDLSKKLIVAELLLKGKKLFGNTNAVKTCDLSPDCGLNNTACSLKGGYKY